MKYFRYHLLPIGLYLLLLPGLVSSEETGSYVMSETMEYEIKSATRTELTVHRSIFVKDEKGKEYGKVVVGEDRFSKIKSIKAFIKNSKGDVLQKLRRGDIQEYDVSAEWALYSGETVSAFELVHPSLPYILEYSYQIRFESTFFWPGWFPEKDIPVFASKYILRIPDDYRFNMRTVGDIPEPEISDDGETYTWSVNLRPAKATEYRMPPEDHTGLALHFSPQQFELAGTKGDLTSWESFGRWYGQLARDQYSIDTTTVQDLQVPDSLNTRGKIAAIYEYVQHKTHYVAVELGIHGWKPHSAQTVCDKRYGDCKDLTTFFIALLKNEGIPAYPVLIKTRDNGKIYPEFPTKAFNHAIACVPLREDTLWIDCTSDHATIDDLPAYDEGCTVLVIGDEEGQLTQTPLSKSSDNRQVLNSVAEFQEDGSLHWRGTIDWYGNSSFGYRYGEEEWTDERKRKIIVNLLDDAAPALRIQQMLLERIDENSGHVRLSFDCIIEKYANISKQRIFFNPNIINRFGFDAEDPDNRKTDVYYEAPFTVVDSVQFLRPEGYTIEVLPDSGGNVNPFGEFHHTMAATDSILAYTRQYAIHNRIISKEVYADYFKFREYVESQDRRQVVLRKK